MQKWLPEKRKVEKKRRPHRAACVCACACVFVCVRVYNGQAFVADGLKELTIFLHQKVLCKYER